MEVNQFIPPLDIGRRHSLAGYAARSMLRLRSRVRWNDRFVKRHTLADGWQFSWPTTNSPF
jgi:hypothetical protein